ERQATPQSRRGARFEELRVLIVDDDFLFSDMLPKLLVKSVAKPQIHALSARTPREALRLLEAQRFDVVLCDYDLRDGLSGFDVLRAALRAEGAPLRILISGHRPGEVPSMPEGAFDAFLEKPMTLREVVPLFLDLLHERLGIEFETRR